VNSSWKDVNTDLFSSFVALNQHLTSYRNVVIVVHTSSIEGISENDLNLAKIVDKEVKIDYSRQWLKEHPQAQATAKN